MSRIFNKERFVNLIVVSIILAGAILRAGWYGDLRLSIANSDTGSYIISSRSPLFSWKIFAGRRLFTMNIIYKLANDEERCQITAFSAPALGEEGEREIQPCFDKIVILQNAFAIFGWSFLAWMLSRRLRNVFSRIAIAVLIVVFAFTPQIAEWDSLLSPESFTFSLLMISFALLLEIALRGAESREAFKSPRDIVLLTAWTITFVLWVFIRDVNLYAVPTTLALAAPLLLVGKFRKSKSMLVVLALLVGVFILGFQSARDSLRATHSLVHAFDAYIWPYPSRSEFIEGFGMPARNSPEFEAWFNANATTTYGLFLLSHPGFVVTTLWENFEQLTSDYLQPYFYTSDIKFRDALLLVGELLHPETGAVYLLGLLLLAALLVRAAKMRNRVAFAWSWLAAWFFAIAAITLLLTFFGDIDGTRRHIFPSVEMFRLFVWVFLIVLLDLPFQEAEERSTTAW